MDFIIMGTLIIAIIITAIIMVIVPIACNGNSLFTIITWRKPFILQIFIAGSILISIIGVGYYLVTQPMSDKQCGIDSCYYYNVSAYNNWCKLQYGNNFTLVKTVDNGMGGFYYYANDFSLYACVRN